jgi:hypothetical protein
MEYVSIKVAENYVYKIHFCVINLLYFQVFKLGFKNAIKLFNEMERPKQIERSKYQMFSL